MHSASSGTDSQTPSKTPSSQTALSGSRTQGGGSYTSTGYKATGGGDSNIASYSGGRISGGN